MSYLTDLSVVCNSDFFLKKCQFFLIFKHIFLIFHVDFFVFFAVVFQRQIRNWIHHGPYVDISSEVEFPRLQILGLNFWLKAHFFGLYALCARGFLTTVTHLSSKVDHPLRF